MAGPSFFQSSGIAPGGGHLIGTDCAVDLLGDKLKDDGSCCVPVCGCWCIAVIAYQWTNFMGDPTLCAACVGKSAFHINGGPTGPICATHGGFHAGDTFTFNAPIGDGVHCSEWYTGAPSSPPHITLTLGNTFGWVLGYSDALFKVYWNIHFQNATETVTRPFVCCNMTSPCYTNVDIPHTHSPPSGPTCMSDLSIHPCDLATGVPCPALDCFNFPPDPVTSCPDIVMTPFVPTYLFRNDTC